MTKVTLKPNAVQDRIKQTLKSKSIPVYDWMLECGMMQADLMVYAAMFDELRKEPLTPMSSNLAELGRRINYERCSVYHSIDNLITNHYLFRQGEGRDAVYSLYPFDTLDLK